MLNRQRKNAQAQIITTVLLILIAIGAIAVVSVFIFSLVSDNLSGTDCFKTVGQFEIKSGNEGSTCYGGNGINVTIERGQETEVNLTGFSVTVGNSEESKSYEITTNLPEAGEKKTWQLDVTDVTGGVDSVSVVPIIQGDKQCADGKTEKTVTACS